MYVARVSEAKNILGKRLCGIIIEGQEDIEIGTEYDVFTCSRSAASPDCSAGSPLFDLRSTRLQKLRQLECRLGVS